MQIIIANSTLQELNTFLEKLNTSYSLQLTSILTDANAELSWLNKKTSNVTDRVMILDDESNESSWQIDFTSIKITGLEADIAGMEADIAGLEADINLIKGNLGIP